MIINVGARTDIVNHYGEWLRNRLKEGFAYSRNPLFPNHVTRYDLNPQNVDGIIFCSKNYKPILSWIDDVATRYRIICYYTISAYGRDIEPGIPDVDECAETLIELSSKIGKEKVIWRYDPVFLTEKYTMERHIDTFDRLSSKLSGHFSLCIFSFIEMYRHLDRTLPELLAMTDDERDSLLRAFGEIARNRGFRIQTCGTDADFTHFGIEHSGCVTTSILGEAFKCKFKNVSHTGQRKGCHCLPSRDLGAYNTCPNGCRYCYANKKPELIRANCAAHDVHSPLLVGNIRSTDIIHNGNQKTLILNDNK